MDIVMEATAKPDAFGRYITVAQAARMVCRSKQTLHHWISKGILRGPQGLCYVQGRPLIDREMFERAFVVRPVE